jgi:hypothetical protein
VSGAEEAQTAFSAAHFLYIPICVVAGVVLGWILGSRSARDEIAQLRRQLDTEQERQAAMRLGQKKP